MSFTKRTRAAQTRLHGLHLPADAGAAGHVSHFGEVPPVVVFLWGIGKLDVGPVDRGHRGQTLELFGDLGQHTVDAELWLSGEGFLAHGAQELLAVIPKALQTGLTESVAAGSGDGLDEDLQTDGAGELLLRQDLPRRLRTCQPLRERDVIRLEVVNMRAGRREVVVSRNHLCSSVLLHTRVVNMHSFSSFGIY